MIEFLRRIIDFIRDKFRGIPLGGGRSSKWDGVRVEYLKENPACAVCAVCGTKKHCEVHHCIPFSIDQSQELNPLNFITLCREHHFFIGHLNSWKSWNSEVREDSEYFKNKIENRP